MLQDIWYPIAWADDIGRTPLGRMIANEPLVIFMSEEGAPIVLSDTCPHRFAPMHRGRVVGNTIECGYHGLRFGADGSCVHNPHGSGARPRAARLTRYPSVSQDTIIWAWIGDPERADIATIPSFPWLNGGDGLALTGNHTMHMPLSWELIVDNLLDLSHASYLHPDTLGFPPGAREKVGTSKNGNTVVSERMLFDSYPAFVWRATNAVADGQKVDHWADMRWDPPGCFYLDVGVMDVGTPRETGNYLSSVQLVVPETETTSFYLWKMFRNYEVDNHEMTLAIEDAATKAFATEDEPMIAAVQRRMAGRDFWEMKPLLLPQDAAAVQARRIIQKLSAAGPA